MFELPLEFGAYDFQIKQKAYQMMVVHHLFPSILILVNFTNEAI
jgi:hypothetical protein